MDKITSDSYIMKFGKYSGMKATDIAQLTTVKQNRKKEEYTEQTGLKYLKFICSTDWFKHTNIIQEIIKKYDGQDDKEESK